MSSFTIRKARPEEHPAIGELLVDTYAGLPGMPSPDEQPGYYATLREVAARTRRPSTTVLVAISDTGQLLGCVDCIDDMQHYGSGGSAGSVPDAAGIRLLAVSPGARGQGIGKALTVHCIERARGLGRARVILHTTRAMQTAWAMYERLGFERFPAIDFRQGALEVFGFGLKL